MTADRSQPDFEEELLAQFLRELETATDRAAVLKEYTARHPAMADELAQIEHMNRLAASAGRDEAPDVPAQLGEFRIVRWITRGGMGDIYEAVQDRLNRRVVVKTIRRGRIAPHLRGRFFREQRVLARLHQTHIVPIHTAGEEGDLLYFAMPFIDGAALSQLVRTASAFETRGPGSKTPSLATLAERVTVAAPEVATLAQTKPAAAPPGCRPRNLSGAYFRSVAQVIADAAEAVEHAHRLKILHRDLKPSNILIDRQGQCWIIDFGLAGYLGQVGVPADEKAIDDGEALTVGGIIGTPQYMAPEQWRGEPADARTDVWGLGATLYELLTLRRAFDGPTDGEAQERVLVDEPPPPRTLVRNVPRDLAAICRKSLSKEPSKRYPTAQALADDLRRWLRLEPVTARPAWAFRRLTLWTQRNPGWAAALAFTLAAILAIVGLEVRHERRQAAQDRGERLKLELQQARLGKHRDGWRDRELAIAADIHHLRPAEDLRDHTAALLTGLDATREMTFPGGASAAAIDRTVGRLLLGGLNDGEGHPKLGARLVDLATREVLSLSRLPGTGPVAFRADGTALQLVPKADDRWTLVLWDVARQRSVRTFSMADAKPEEVREETYPILALSEDGALAAAAAFLPDSRSSDDPKRLRVWDTRTGSCLHEWDQRARSLAFSPNGSLMAVGDAGGDIAIRTLADGKLLVTLHSGGRAIECLTFGRDPWQREDHAGADWLLAAGDASSRVTVWDLHDRSPRCRCFGSWFGINTLAFSPDGMTLASAGRSDAKLWDLATGRLMLEVAVIEYGAGVAFDPTGRRFAVTGLSHPRGEDQVEVWNLENGRGTATLSGLVGPVAKTAFSADGRHVAALSQQWQVGVWDRAAGRLLLVLDGPRGEFVDNAALAFDPAESRLACSGGNEAILWDLTTGRRSNHWHLPPGLQDALAFDPTGRELWSVRCETTTGFPPYSHADYREHRRVYPVRNLFGAQPTNPVKVVSTPDDHPDYILVTPDASAVAISAFRIVEGGKRHSVRAFALPAETELWSAPAKSGHLTMDPLGKLLGFPREDSGPVIVALHSGEVIRLETGMVGPGGTWRLHGDLRLGVGGAEVAGLDIDKQIAEGSQFSPCGRFLAVGRKDGTVVIYELEAFRRSLGEFTNR